MTVVADYCATRVIWRDRVIGHRFVWVFPSRAAAADYLGAVLAVGDPESITVEPVR